MDILIISLLGGLMASDATAAGQFMLSRPIVCAPVVGLITGDIQSGLMVGIIMELVWISVIPLGNAVPPDSTVVAVAAAYLGSVFSPASPEASRGFIVFTVLLLIPFGILFKKLDIIHREYNSILSGEIEDRIRSGDLKAVDRGIYRGWLLFILKGALFLAVLMAAGRTVFVDLYGLLGVKGQGGLSHAFYLIPSVGLGTAVTTFIFKKSRQR